MLNILNTAQTGLSVSQSQIDNTMNNIANQNTDGYKKRVVNVSELDHLDTRTTGRGVIVDDVSRTTDIYMYQNLLGEQSQESSYTELNNMLSDIESIFSETDDAGLSADLNRYFAAIENLRTSPDNEVYKNDFKNSAIVLTDDLKTLYSDVEDLEKTTLDQAKDSVEDINDILNQIGDLSKQIVESPDKRNDLLDRRDALEQKLSKYIDIDISRDEPYELKIGSVTAVRFDTNVHSLNIAENYIPQADRYVVDNKYPFESNLINKDTWNKDDNKAEKQTIKLEDEANSQVYFLGAKVANADGSDGHKTPSEIVDDITDNTNNNTDNIIKTWNDAHPDKQIDTIEEDPDDDEQLIITYKDTMGDMPTLPEVKSAGITFDQSKETQKGYAEAVTYTLNNEVTIRVAAGETVNGVEVNKDNIIQALVYKINTNTDMLGKVTAYNGDYTVDKDGNKIPMDPTNEDHYLVIESTLDGEVGSFDGSIMVRDNVYKDQDGNQINNHVQTSTFSTKATDDIHLEIYNEEVPLESGKLKPMIDNIKTDSGDNKFDDYKNKLDQFAKALADLSNSYIEHDDDTYIYGTNASEENKDYDKMVSLNLFTGSDVKSLTFNTNSANTLTQDNLDYLAKIQWKDDIDFDGSGENNSSMSEFYQSLRFDIANDRETVRFKEESQKAVRESIESSYDKLTKVDNDAELVDLMKYQKAYQANAKMITIVDELLDTILNMKR